MSELKNAIQAIDSSPSSVAKIGLIEQAIRLADSLGEEWQAFSLRDDLISVCTEYGQFMKALVAFSWCLAKLDEKPQEYRFNYSMVWNYSALLTRAAAFDQVSLERLHGLLADFAKRMKAIGASERNLHESAIRIGIILRDKEMTLAARDGIKKHHEDAYTDCEACAQNVLVHTELCFGSFEEAMKLAQPLIDKKMSCNMVPLRTFGIMINYMHRAGGYEELAWRLYQRGIKLIGKKGGFLEQIGNYLIYLSEVKLTEATKVYQNSLPWALNETEMPWSVFHFHIGAHILFIRQAAKRKAGKLKLDNRHLLYKEPPEGEKSSSYDYLALADYHAKEADALAARFDKRNGNKIASELFAKEKAYMRYQLR
ncbi:MAG: hypothetical protein LBV04_01410 [Deferribacteraceae bacterium]|nr:hypothetical protein [Deferribacteraceae bacterium]